MIAAPTDLLDWIALGLEAVFAVVLPAELIWLFWRGRLSSTRVREMLASAATYIPIVLFSGAYLAVVGAVFYWVGQVRPWIIPTNAWSAVLCLLAVDLFYYWEHRLEHGVRGLWALYHSVHHSSHAFDQTTSIRISVFDLAITTYFYLPLVFLGFDPALVAACLAVALGYQTWIHTEMIGRLGWFDRIFNSPSNHRVHHAAQTRYLDRNFGAILIVWDRLFGTYEPESEQPVYGLTESIGSSNPLRIHFHELLCLVRDWRAAGSLGVALQMLWRAPGWKPR